MCSNPVYATLIVTLVIYQLYFGYPGTGLAFWVETTGGCCRGVSHKKSTLGTGTLQGGQNVPKFLLFFFLSDRSDVKFNHLKLYLSVFTNLSTRFSDSFPGSDLSCFYLQFPRLSV